MNKFIYHITINRNRYFKIIGIFLILSFIAYLLLDFRFCNHEYDGCFFAIWSVLSVFIGSLVFIQLNENLVYNNLEGLMRHVIRMIHGTDNKLYIITPNINLGQNKYPDYFEKYREAIKQSVEKGVIIHIVVWGLEKKLLFFNMNISEATSYCEDANGTGVKAINDKTPHLQYVSELFDKQTEKLQILKRDYNDFISFLKKEQSKERILFYTAKSSDLDNRFFLIYNGKRLFYSNIKDNRMKSEVIRESEFINTIWKSICDKYFRQPAKLKI